MKIFIVVLTYLFIIFVVFASVKVRAQEPSPETEAAVEKPVVEKPVLGAKKAPQEPKVLDFEADVIEGERKTPNLFLQLEVDTPNLDTLLYQRSNFNDFHDLEKDRRPIYRKVAK